MEKEIAFILLKSDPPKNSIHTTHYSLSDGYGVIDVWPINHDDQSNRLNDNARMNHGR